MCDSVSRRQKRPKAAKSMIHRVTKDMMISIATSHNEYITSSLWSTMSRCLVYPYRSIDRSTISTALSIYCPCFCPIDLLFNKKDIIFLSSSRLLWVSKRGGLIATDRLCCLCCWWDGRPGFYSVIILFVAPTMLFTTWSLLIRELTYVVQCKILQNATVVMPYLQVVTGALYY